MPLLLSAVTGLTVGLGAILIKTIIFYIEEYAISFFPGFFYFLIPTVGLLLVAFLNRNLFFKTNYFKSTRNVIEAIERRSSIINFRLIYSKFITTGTSIGFGGSSGLEAAIITSGSAIGSNVGTFFGADYKLRTLLIGCGVAGGISAIYNAPVGGFLFALETILPQFTPTLLIPLLVSAVCGKILFEVFMGDQFRFQAAIPDFTYDQLPFVIMLGVAGMLVSIYFHKTYQYCFKWFSLIKNDYLRALAGGISLGSVIFLFPPMYGEGYVSTSALLRANEEAVFSHTIFQVVPHTNIYDLIFMFLLVLAKPISTGINVNAGGEGGYFAPSIITGSFLGYFFYKAIFLFAPGADQVVSPVTYIYLGMAATFACVMKAPITAIFLIADITQSYQLFVPLMLVSATAYFLKYYIENLREKSVLPTEDDKITRMERVALNHISASELLDKNFAALKPDDMLGKLADVIQSSPQDIIPILNDEGELVGTIQPDDIREQLYFTHEYDTVKLKNFMQIPPTTISMNEPVSSVMEKFDKTNSWYLPVIRNGQFRGFVSRIRVLTRYRNEINKSNQFF